MHAGVVIPAGDHAGREKLLRYLARAPLSLERMSLMPDGRVAYELRHAWRAGRTHVLLEPMQLMARLAALVPPPRHPLLRFHGAFAPKSPARKHVVPLVPRRLAEGAAAAAGDAGGRGSPAARSKDCAPSRSKPFATSGQPTATQPAPAQPPSDVLVTADGRPAPSRTHWYIDWATLLRRVYDVDALACPCGGKLRFIELVDNERDARAFLETRGAILGLTDEPTPPRMPFDGDTWGDPSGLDDFSDALPDYDAVDPPPDSS